MPVRELLFEDIELDLVDLDDELWEIQRED
jgi:hypothetical protein